MAVKACSKHEWHSDLQKESKSDGGHDEAQVLGEGTDKVKGWEGTGRGRDSKRQDSKR